MILTKEQIASFQEAAKPMIKWINDNCSPHTLVNIDCNSAEVLSSAATIHTDEFIND